MAHSMTQPTWVTQKDESRELMAVWPDVVRDLTEANEYSDIPNIEKWISKVSDGLSFIKEVHFLS